MGQRQRVIDLAVEACGGSVLNRRIGVLGAAFKPHTDDVRDSPALNVAAALHLRGAQVTVYDPAGRRHRTLAASRPSATRRASRRPSNGADVVLVLTEWDEFLEADPAHLATRSRSTPASSTPAASSTPRGGARPAGRSPDWAARRSAPAA